MLQVSIGLSARAQAAHPSQQVLLPQRGSQCSEPVSPWGIREVSLEEVRVEMGLEGWTGID